MDWKWDELASLLSSYCANSTITAAASAAPVAPQNRLEDIFMKLEIPWADYLAMANQNSNRSVWTKDIYKTWIQFYEKVMNAYNLYMANLNAPAIDANTTTVTSEASAADASGSSSSSSSSSSSTPAAPLTPVGGTSNVIAMVIW